MSGWFCHASGIIMRTAWGRERPARWSSSSTSSKEAESLASGGQMGSSGSRSPSSSEEATPSRAAIQLRFPRTVLISPLWATSRKGWASGHDGKVLVEKREWTSARDRKSTRLNSSHVAISYAVFCLKKKKKKHNKNLQCQHMQ